MNIRFLIIFVINVVIKKAVHKLSTIVYLSRKMRWFCHLLSCSWKLSASPNSSTWLLHQCLAWTPPVISTFQQAVKTSLGVRKLSNQNTYKVKCCRGDSANKTNNLPVHCTKLFKLALSCNCWRFILQM